MQRTPSLLQSLSCMICHVRHTTGTLQAAARLLTLVLLHRTAEPQRAATTAAKTALGLHPSLLGPLLEALLHWMGGEQGHGAAAGVLSDTAAGGEDPVKAPLGAFANHFGVALMALVPGQQGQHWQEGRQKHKRRQGQQQQQHARHLNADELALLLLAAHHPAISAGLRDGTRVWAAVKGCMPSLPQDVAGGWGWGGEWGLDVHVHVGSGGSTGYSRQVDA